MKGILIPIRAFTPIMLFLFVAWISICSAMAASVDVETVNRLIAEGKLSDVRTVLAAAVVTTTGEEKAKAAKMLEQLQSYIGERRSDLALSAAAGRPPTPDGTYAVTHLGGYKDGWIVVATRDSDYTTQRMSGFSAKFPEEWIRQQWQEELHITTLSGDKHGWCVVMSRTIDQKVPKQQYFGPAPADEKLDAWIQNHWKAGLRITAVAGWRDQWVVVMTEDTGWGRQQLLKPGGSEQRISDWSRARQAEGYSITAMNGNFTFQSETKQRLGASFMLVATQGLKLSEQRLEIDVPIPGSGQINTEAPVRIIAGYGEDNKPAIVLRGGSPVEGSRQMVGTGADCEKLIRRVWNEFHELDDIAKQLRKTSGE